MANKLALEITVGADGLAQGLRVATQDVQKFANNFDTTFKTAGKGAQEASKHVSGFMGVLKEFKSEQVQQARTARFFASELTSIIPGAEGAKGALQGLIGAGVEGLAGGGVFAVGFELAKVAMETFAEEMGATKKAAKEAQRAYSDTADAIGKSLKGVRESLEPVTATQKAWNAEVDKVKEKNREVFREASEYASSFSAKMRDYTAAFVDMWDISMRTSADVIAETMAKADAGNSALAMKDKDRARTAALEKKKIHREFIAEQGVLEAKSKDDITQVNAQLAADLNALDDKLFATKADKHARERELEREAAEKIKDIRAKRDLAAIEASAKVEEIGSGELLKIENDFEAEKLRIQFEYRNRTGDDDQKALLRDLALAQKRHDKLVEIEVETNDAILREKRKEFAKQDIEEKKRLAGKVGPFVDPIVSAFHQGILSMIKDAKSFDEVMKESAIGMAEAMGTAVENMVAKKISEQIAEWIFTKTKAVGQVSENAAIAGSAAAASVAGVPVVGPALAAGAMAETSALVLSSMMPLASASGGYDIGIGVNPIVQAHAEEMILPKDIANPLRENLSNGGMGGGLTLIVQNHGYMDTHGLQKLGQDPHFLTGLRESKRNGRL